MLEERQDSGYWRDACRELVQDRPAMVGLFLIFMLILGGLASLLYPIDPLFQHRLGLSIRGEPRSPSLEFWLGTDSLGRDVLSRLLHGARVSLTVGLGVNVVAAVLGTTIGGIGGIAGPRLQTILMRLVDVVLGFPVILLAIAILAVTEPNLLSIILIIGVSFGAYLARIIFTQVVSLREREFVLAAQIAGVKSHVIFLRHIVPHVVPSVTVYCTLGVATAILLEAALSFVGVGIRPPNPSWGNMISDGQTFLIMAPWLVVVPGVAIVIAMFGFSLLGDGLRDVLDPTLERQSRILHGGIR